MSTEPRPAKLHHVVFAVAPERQSQTAQMFADLGFEFNDTELPELGIHVYLDWDGGIELISPLPGAIAEVAASVTDFLDRNGDGVFTVVLRVPDAKDGEAATKRYGSITRFRQGLSGDGTYFEEIDLSVLGLPLTMLATNMP